MSLKNLNKKGVLFENSLYFSYLRTEYAQIFGREKAFMLEKLAKQTAIYGISTILGRMLSYLLTPFYTRIFGLEAYGVVTDVYALIPFAFYPAIISIRLLDEEKLLTAELSGYEEYKQKVKYRLVPFIW